MSQVVYRGNLAASVFPLTAAQFGRTVIVSGQDQNFIRQLYSAVDPDKDVGVPQIYYCENVMPTAAGFQSIGFQPRVAQYAPTALFDKIITLRNVGGDGAIAAPGQAFVGPLFLTGFFVLIPTVGTWVFKSTYLDTGIPQAWPADMLARQITSAYVEGVLYIYIDQVNCYRFNFTLGEFEVQVLNGLTATDIKGISTAQGYLIAYTASGNVFWSSTIVVTDFVPSLATGAGGGSVEALKGRITHVAPVSSGYIVCSEVNAVSATYTGNARFPFAYTECAGAGGLLSPELISQDSNLGATYMYSTYGIQEIGNKKADTVLGYVTDFLSERIFETFDSTTGVFTEQNASAQLVKKLTVIASRYLVLSYGLSSLTYAIIYDLVLKRWGKVKVDHVDCFEYFPFTPLDTDVAKRSIGFVSSTGVINTVCFDNTVARSGVIVLGKYQYVRSRMTVLDSVELEEASEGAVTVYDLPSLDGNTYIPKVDGYPIVEGGDIAAYNFGNVAKNHSVVIKGKFDLNTIVLTLHIHGRR
jgi:hypothetical protein